MRIQHFRQTIFVSMDDYVKCTASMQDWDGCNPFSISAFIKDEQVLQAQTFWENEIEFDLPAVNEPCTLTLKLYPFQNAAIIQTFDFVPVKQFTLDFYLSSHEDLGYCAYTHTLASECADYLDAAIALAEKHPDYAYMIEHYWWLRGYEEYRDESAKRRLKDRMKSGQIILSAPHCSNHTHWQGSEQLIRSMYYGCLDAKRDWDISPKSVVYADIFGTSWSCVSAYASAGIKYLLLLGNRYLRFSTDDEKLPRIFWWQSPNGKDRLLCYWQYGYKQGDIRRATGAANSQTIDGAPFTFDNSRMDATRHAADQMIHDFGDIPYDRIPVSFYMDREYPSPDMKVVCDAMNAAWKYPHFRISTPEQTFAHIEETVGDQLPVLSGDITDQWADFAAISPEWFAKKRMAQTLFPVAESLSLLTLINHPQASWPQARLGEALWKMCEFDDHCWATSSKHPQEMHLFNLNLIKREAASIALGHVETLIAEKNGKPDEKGFSVWNPIPFSRNESLRLEANAIPADVPCQTLSDGCILTAPVALPAFGYRTFTQAAQAPAQPQKENVQRFETPFYKVTLNGESQRIVSVWDKTMECELLDASSRYAMGECVYVHAEQKHDLPITMEFPSRRSMQVYSGALATEVVLESFEEQIGANIRTVFTFYRNEPNIDVHLSFENATGLMGDYYDRYKKNLFFAFPFQVQNHHFCTELANGIVDERNDRLPMNPHDFVVAHQWVSVENGTMGIGLFSREMPVFHLGDIHYNKIASKIDNSVSSSIFLYAASNRTNNLNYRTAEDCHGEFHLSILPFTGESRTALPYWSYTKSLQPITGGVNAIMQHTTLSLSHTNLRLLCFKPAQAQNGVFIRLMETEGKAITGKITLPFAVNSAYLTNVIEEIQAGAMDYEGNTVSFSVCPYAYVNLLVHPEEPLVIQPEILQQSVKNIFTFPVENRNTVICFEKCNDQSDWYSICEGQKEVARVPNEPYHIQKHILPGLSYQALTVVPASNDKECTPWKND